MFVMKNPGGEVWWTSEEKRLSRVWGGTSRVEVWRLHSVRGWDRGTDCVYRDSRRRRGRRLLGSNMVKTWSQGRIGVVLALPSAWDRVAF